MIFHRITSKGKRLSKIFVMQGGVPLLIHVMSIANVAVTAAEKEVRGLCFIRNPLILSIDCGTILLSYRQFIV